MPIEFRSDGRGPQLLALYWRHASTLIAAEFRNPGESTTSHVVFHGCQTVQLTPDEVVGQRQQVSGNALSDLGKSEWLRSFNPQHLGDCRHFQLVFYDELLDIICERIELKGGAFNEDSA